MREQEEGDKKLVQCSSVAMKEAKIPTPVYLIPRPRGIPVVHSVQEIYSELYLESKILSVNTNINMEHSYETTCENKF